MARFRFGYGSRVDTRPRKVGFHAEIAGHNVVSTPQVSRLDFHLIRAGRTIAVEFKRRHRDVETVVTLRHGIPEFSNDGSVEHDIGVVLLVTIPRPWQLKAHFKLGIDQIGLFPAFHAPQRGIVRPSIRPHIPLNEINLTIPIGVHRVPPGALPWDIHCPTVDLSIPIGVFRICLPGPIHIIGIEIGGSKRSLGLDFVFMRILSLRPDINRMDHLPILQCHRLIQLQFLIHRLGHKLSRSRRETLVESGNHLKLHRLAGREQSVIDGRAHTKIASNTRNREIGQCVPLIVQHQFSPDRSWDFSLIFPLKNNIREFYIQLHDRLIRWSRSHGNNPDREANLGLKAILGTDSKHEVPFLSRIQGEWYTLRPFSNEAHIQLTPGWRLSALQSDVQRGLPMVADTHPHTLVVIPLDRSCVSRFSKGQPFHPRELNNRALARTNRLHLIAHPRFQPR
ncbi:MAG: hypothetical protein BWY82_00623 [Verrucomicrobia bacterium ADurb.Bin474]|nr:MAG: hypothetical protein BWY82_00623 [Verrucomicrobia bacterium ADurb.Bin474]